MLDKIIKYILIALSIFLPVHNLISTYLYYVAGFSKWVYLWKEILVCVVAVLIVSKIIRHKAQKKLHKKALIPVILFVLTLILALYTSYLNGITQRELLVGLRFELFWLGFYSALLGYSYTISKEQKTNLLNVLPKVLLIGFIPVIIVNIMVIFIGSSSFYQNLGFNRGWSGSEYTLIDPNYCHSSRVNYFSCRLSAGFNSPNHFAGYVLLILGVCMYSINKQTHQKNPVIYKKISLFLILFLCILFLYLSFARYSWLVLTSIIGYFIIKKLYEYLKVRITKPYYKSIVFIISKIPKLSLFIPVLFWIVMVSNVNIFLDIGLPDEVVRSSSTIEHYKFTKSSLDIIYNNPTRLAYGYGQAQSGPAANNKYYEESIDRDIIQDNLDIAKDNSIRPDKLTLPENWYLQILLNGGIFYLIFYLSVLIWPIISIFKKKYNNLYLYIGIYGVLVGNLFLHIFESQVVSTIYSILIFILILDQNNHKTNSNIAY